MENIARVSLKITDKFTSSISSKQRRKSSKNEFHSDEQSCLSKSLPIKENEDGEKLIVKSKKTIKSPSKSTDQKKNLKRSGNEINHIKNRNTKKIRISQCKNKRKNKVDKLEAKLEYVDSNVNHIKSNKYLSIDYKNSDKKTLVKNIEIEMSNDNIRKIDSNCEIKNINLNTNVNIKSWTRQEDMILLQAIKKEYSENSLAMVSKILGNRTIDQVSKIICCIIYNFLNIFNI